ARHFTFFEMLGNFSFGDYFKEKAIPWAWEFVTRDLGLAPERLWISVYLDDDEAFGHWRAAGVPAERIVRLGKDTNYWEIGVGPCGPCSEIYYDYGPGYSCGSPDCGLGCDCDRYVEIWNLVFIQFFRDEAGDYTPLANKGIDTGMGLERVASVVQGVRTNFDTDLFRGLMDYTAGVMGLEYGRDPEIDTALKVIADHGRAVTFAIADGVLPSNEGRGYVIRRLLRRAVRKAVLLGQDQPFMDGVAGVVVDQMAGAYPELEGARESVRRVVRVEEGRFRQSLIQGTEIINRLIDRARAEGRVGLEGAAAFQLYDTYGFPLELTREICAEQGLAVDEAGFEAALKVQQRKAREARREMKYLDEREAFYQTIRDEVGPTRFVGYELLLSQATVLRLIRDGRRVEAAGAGDRIEVFLDVTPCYAESGGQVGDEGIIEGVSVRGRIEETVAPVLGLYAHTVVIEEGVLQEGAQVRVAVTGARRGDICRNHTATHLLHRTLKEVLGNHVNQAGSLVAPERLRFDFTHFQPVSEDELAELEARINEAVFSNLEVETFETSFGRARELGAVALFGEKYGDVVRVVQIGDYSRELCGGTHVLSTAQIGLFKITAEAGIGAGLRRLEAATGRGALELLNSRNKQLSRIAQAAGVPVQDLVTRVERLTDESKELQRENEHLKDRLRVFEVKEILDRTGTHNGVNVLATSVRARDIAELRGMVDLLRDRLGSSVIVLGSVVEGKVSLVASVTPDLVPRGVHAGTIVKEAAAVAGGGGGGRPEMAQAGGRRPDKLAEALEKAREVALRQMG
ncbi:MAG: alanine--tRNA ligase, partial [Candidatus Desulforudis sp.]|nr:alanine--tRNA ligase [Desulforudis sp.]